MFFCLIALYTYNSHLKHWRSVVERLESAVTLAGVTTLDSSFHTFLVLPNHGNQMC